jgi:hypothetical protein
MNYKNKIARIAIFMLLLVGIFAACKKQSRPALGDYPKDNNPPGGPLKFYAAFDGTTTNPLMNAVDSIRANFPSVNPFTIIDGVEGKAAKGVDMKALLYPSANDFDKSTSFTIAFWEKNSVPTGGDPQFLFSLASKDYWEQSSLFMLIDHDQADPSGHSGSSVDSAIVKVAIEDYWFEFTQEHGKMPGHLLNGNWHHIAIAYDETTSKLTYYIDGQALTGLNPKLTDFLDGNGHPFGKVHFTNTYAFVLGGWNKHVSLGNGAPTDSWIQSWQGGLDQFRMYNKVLTAAEVQALYNNKQ